MIKQPTMQISLIVAADRDGVIGSNGAMPWHLPGDLRYFKQVTMGKPVIMGQKTWESLKKRPLPGRVNIVLTRRRSFEAAGAHIAHSLEAALETAKRQAVLDKQSEIFIIGGGEVFRQAFPFADRLYWTEILSSIAGDTFFKPKLSERSWDKKLISTPKKQAGDSHDYRFWRYEKRAAARKSALKNAQNSRHPGVGGSLSAFFCRGNAFGLSLRRIFSIF